MKHLTGCLCFVACFVLRVGVVYAALATFPGIGRYASWWGVVNATLVVLAVWILRVSLRDLTEWSSGAEGDESIPRGGRWTDVEYPEQRVRIERVPKIDGGTYSYKPYDLDTNREITNGYYDSASEALDATGRWSKEGNGDG